MARRISLQPHRHRSRNVNFGGKTICVVVATTIGTSGVGVYCGTGQTAIGCLGMLG